MGRTILGAVVLAVVVFIAGFALGRFGLFPLLPWQVPTLDQMGAAVSTANAAWFQVAVTFLAFGATVCVFISAFVLQRQQSEDATKLQRAQFDDDRVKAAEARRSNGKDAIETIKRAHALVTKMRDKYCQLEMPNKKHEIWADLSEIQTHQVIIQHFVNSPLTDLAALFLLGSASHRVYEIRDALKKLVPDGNQVATDDDRKWCREILVRATILSNDDQLELSEAARRYE